MESTESVISQTNFSRHYSKRCRSGYRSGAHGTNKAVSVRYMIMLLASDEIRPVKLAAHEDSTTSGERYHWGRNAFPRYERTSQGMGRSGWSPVRSHEVEGRETAEGPELWRGIMRIDMASYAGYNWTKLVVKWASRDFDVVIDMARIHQKVACN